MILGNGRHVAAVVSVSKSRPCDAAAGGQQLFSKVGSLYSFEQLPTVFASVLQRTKPIMQAALSLHTVIAAAAAANCWCCQCFVKGTLAATLPH